MSPIFPVVPEGAPAQPTDNSRFVALLCPLNAFKFIGRQPQDMQRRLWFSLGIAAVVIFAQKPEDLDEFITKEKHDLSAYEIWTLDENHSVSVYDSWIRPISFTPPRLTYPQDVPKDTLRLIDEIQGNLHEAARVAALFMPEQLPRLARVTDATNEIIAELDYLESPTTKTPPAHFAKRKDQIGTDVFGIHQRLNQRITQLIQLNSALAYVVSQTSHGSVPILEGPCLVSTHSLLGIGTAYRAISAAVAFVEETFENCPILSVIDRVYRTERGVDVFADVVRYNRDRWLEVSVGIDQFLSKGEQESNRPKVAYFSSRLGFAETHFSVTCATQVLHAADSVRWSLMTLTHELLHSHVTGILATVFGEDVKEGLTWSSFVKLHDEFHSFVQAHDRAAPDTMLDSLRYMIFAFGVSRYEAISKLEESEHRGAGEMLQHLKFSPKLPDQTDLFAAFYRSSLRLLEEIIVHTLDLYYFYSGNTETYLELLWLSWTTVPAVVGDLETYLLRSLAAIATIEDGTVSQRFDLARGHLLSKLAALLQKTGEENVFLRKAHEHLKDTGKTCRLRLLFYPAVYAADMTACFLRSRRLEAELLGKDENIEPSGEGEFFYLMETCEFSGNSVTNPIAFIADRLRRDATEYGNLDEDYRTAWLLLACASGVT